MAKPIIEIVPSVAAHVQEAGQRLREADNREVMALGLTPHKALWHSYRSSVLRRTLLVNGEVAAMWGVSGVLFSMKGQIWLLTTPVTETISALTFARMYRNEVREALKSFPTLENWVDSSYHSAVRLLQLAGAKLDDPAPFGPHGALFQHFTMKA